MKKVGICNTRPVDLIDIKHTLNKYGLNPVAQPDRNEELEFVLAIGGDGAVLKAMHSAMEHDVPILGYHTGTLGFLTSGEVLENLLIKWQDGMLNIEERLLLLASAYMVDDMNEVPVATHVKVMNEVAITADKVGSLLINRVTVDGKYVTTYKGDGLCISTPSGSTAWNLSAGGPILHPSNESVVLTPMNPFTLSTRPLVVDADSVIEISPVGQVIIDGVRFGREDSNEKCVKMLISRYSKPVKLYMTKEYCFFESIRAKLGWNNNIKQ